MAESLKNKIIWDNFREGSKEALEIIYEENYAPLFHYGLKFTKDECLVQDVIQELFIELINSGTRLASTNNIRFYLLRALRNKLIRQLYNPKIYKIEDGLLNEIEFSLIESVESQLIQQEMEEQLRTKLITSIKNLSAKQQEIIYLRFYNNMPYTEIADLFNVKIQTVRNLVNRAITSMKTEMDERNIGKELILLVLRSHL